MSVLYRELATWTLRDLAKRKRLDDRVTLEGKHVSAQFLRPVRLADERAEQFAVRTRNFWKSLPRQSDRSERLALACEAFHRAGEKTYSAAYHVLEILRVAPTRKRGEHNRLGIGCAYKPIKFALGTTRRGHRRKRKKRGVTNAERQAESIRAQASRFIRRHKNFEALFLARLGSFKYTFWRDSQWYADAEKSYLARVAAFEMCSEPFEWWSAMPLPAAAYFYHEQRKFGQAVVHYRKAIGAARRANMHQGLRSFVIRWMRLGIKLCLRSAKVVQMPPYAGPWLPQDHPDVTNIEPLSGHASADYRSNSRRTVRLTFL
jgi:hypothetical protein